MRKNVSPWIHQLNHTRQWHTLPSDIETDVAIVGAGIAGVATAFFILKNTDKKVVMLERHKLAHGATGHNAGQVVSYFERSFSSMVDEYGLLKAAEGQKAVDDAWLLLDEMYTEAGLDIPFSRFEGHDGLSSLEQIVWHLKNAALRRKAGLTPYHVYISKLSNLEGKIPKEYEGLYTIIAEKVLLALLETGMRSFVGALSYQKGCINSALFCQEVFAYLQKHYPERFALYEQTPVHKVLLTGKRAVLDAHKHTVSAKRVVLCTNGFENLHIINEAGLDIDAKYHYLLSGKVGFMSGYLETMHKPPVAISYYTDPIASLENSYYYLTRRPYEYETGAEHNLISVGGPDMNIEETFPYTHEAEYPEHMSAKIDDFLHKVYKMDEKTKIDYIFTWHGLMGYTRHGIRLVGEEPQNRTLLYNLGCNGVGILPSIYGGRKIARHIAGEEVAPSIFDVPIMRR